MLRNQFNTLLRSPHEDAPPTSSGSSTAPTTEPATEGEATGGEGESGEADERAADPEPAADPAPSASQTPTPLSAFERGKLRALGMGGLISRVEKAEGELTSANDSIATLTAENIRLTSELAELKKETPKKIAAAATGRANEVSQALKSELVALGINEAAAPSQVGADVNPAGILEKFNSLTGAAKIAFFRANTQALKEADAAFNLQN